MIGFETYIQIQIEKYIKFLALNRKFCEGSIWEAFEIDALLLTNYLQALNTSEILPEIVFTFLF